MTANSKFKIGDKVIAVKDTPQLPEGWVGYITSTDSSFGYHAEENYGSDEFFAFEEHELELLSPSVRIPNGPDRDDITPQEVQGIKKSTSALDKQVGGGHYKDKGIQPIQYIFANNLGFCEANIVKYASRWKEKNGIQDLEKIIHYTELLIEQARKEGFE